MSSSHKPRYKSVSDLIQDLSSPSFSREFLEWLGCHHASKAMITYRIAHKIDETGMASRLGMSEAELNEFEDREDSRWTTEDIRRYREAVEAGP